ncbi:SRF-TF-domain-containing protein, partial [Macrolepiota fuliginosa MF-IS2]
MHPGTSAPADGHPPSTGAPPAPVGDDAFINDHDAVDSGGDDDEDEEKPKSDKKAGRRKIKIEFIQDKSRRHITFSKRKAGKAYELSTLTGTQVLLLVVSETGLVYTFTTAKLQPLVTQPEGKNLIQACLNAPHGSLPSSMPVGAPLNRASGPMTMGPPPPGPNNLPGGLSISGAQTGNPIKEDQDGDEEDE